MFLGEGTCAKDSGKAAECLVFFITECKDCECTAIALVATLGVFPGDAAVDGNVTTDKTDSLSGALT